jgi:hypothetical protein
MKISTTEPDELYICVLIRLVSTLTKSGTHRFRNKEAKFGGISLSHYAWFMWYHMSNMWFQINYASRLGH